VPRCFSLALCLVALAACASEPSPMGRALLLTEKGNYPAARELLETRLAQHPEDAASRRLLIRIHGFTGDLGRAQREAERLSALLGSNDPSPIVELGYAFELSHRYDEALALYDRAAELAPGDALGPRTGGLRAARWGEHEIARPRLEEALRRAPRDAEVWHALGLTCVALHDLDSAERAYRSGLRADPDALSNQIGLATVALVRKDPAAALHAYDAVLARRPKFADAFLGRSFALIALGRFDEAEVALAEGARLGADRSVVARQKRAIAELRAARRDLTKQ
jgi:tetratricopeptide (TPR) repeat protein